MNLKPTRVMLGLIAVFSFIAGFVITPTAGAIVPPPTVPIITTVAGTGTGGFSGDGGLATAAQITNAYHVAVDDAGNVYIADYGNSRIRKIDTAGIITTLAGTATAGFSGDGGLATNAQVNYPTAVAVDGDGNVYIADFSNNRIRKIDTAGIITTVAGTGVFGFSGDGGLATAAQISRPYGVAVETDGTIFIADGLNSRVRKVDTEGIISTIAGNGVFGFAGDGGPATAAQVNLPSGLAVDNAGNVYIADQNNHRIRKIDAEGMITTVAGTGTAGYSGDNGPGTEANIYSAIGVAADSAGNVYIGDTINHRVRKVDTNGTITTIAGTGTGGFSGDDGPATAAQLNRPIAIAVSANGNIYFSDYFNHRIRLITLPDTTAPVVTITTPTKDVEVGAALKANFTCTDAGGSGIAACTATVNDLELEDGETIDTSTVGSRVLTVTATDGAGNKTTKSITVKVIKKAVVDVPVVNPRVVTGKFAKGTGVDGSVSRLYIAVFGRQPDGGGHLYWVEQQGKGVTLWEIAREFVASDEFVATYADLDNKTFVELLYTNVMGRDGETEGVGYWTNLLETKTLDRGGVTLMFGESPELKNITETS